MQNPPNFEQYLAELEMKIAFQEKTIEELNQALIQQQFSIDKMHVQLRYLVNHLRDIQASNSASAAEVTPPPHWSDSSDIGLISLLTTVPLFFTI